MKISGRIVVVGLWLGFGASLYVAYVELTAPAEVHNFLAKRGTGWG